MPSTMQLPAAESFRKEAGTRCTRRPSASSAKSSRAYTKKIIQDVPAS